MAAAQKNIRAVILGAERTGKSALVKKYIHSIFTGDYDPSFETVDKKLTTIEGRTYCLDLIPAEPAGENLLCQTGEAFILLYAIDNRKSFQHLRQLHAQVKQAKARTSLANFPIFIVGSKADLESERKVSLEEGRQLAVELQCQKLFEISAKDHQVEIDDLFEKLVREVIRVEQGSTINEPTSPLSQQQSPPVRPRPVSRKSSVMDRLKFGSLRRKSSMQTLSRQNTDNSLSENMPPPTPTSRSVRSVSYGTPLSTPRQTPALPTPFRLDVDTSSWRETVKWPTEIIPEEDYFKAR
ncbi:RAS1 protein [Lithohypha guttulata]|uniref:small monomeric GTPase n=1 Tax=Lithohypha guttulata TaxID=1690604 RepID=A0AAN7SZP2_9EURO|nr:RAS1 protein [Lithohypha guttulata]